MAYFAKTIISLTSVTSVNVAGTDDSVVIQAQLWSTNAAIVLVNVDAAPTLTDNIGRLANGDTMWIQTYGYTTIQFKLVTAAGANQTAGANDNVMYRGAAGLQVI